MDPADYARLSELRRRLRLTDEALAGIGCDPSAGSGQVAPAAEAALSRLRAWYEANRVAWDARLTATVLATRQLQAALRQLHAGPAGGGQLRATIRQRKAVIAAAQQAEAQLLAAAAEQVAPAFTDTQRAPWAEAGTDTSAANGMPLRSQSPVPPTAAEQAEAGAGTDTCAANGMPLRSQSPVPPATLPRPMAGRLRELSPTPSARPSPPLTETSAASCRPSSPPPLGSSPLHPRKVRPS